LRQIIVNLVGNALKFTASGEVVVHVGLSDATESEAELHAEVRDTGIGIPKDKQRAIFEAFSQADTSTTRKFGGTGLGLAISTRLVELMNGRIWVESEEGVGTRFHFLVRLGISPHPVPRHSTDVAALKGLPVLVIDDNATNRRILLELLASWGMNPAAAEGGMAALAMMREAASAGRPYSVVLLDCLMPEMDGFGVAEQIQHDPAIAGATVLMLSSAGRPDDMARCRSLAIARCLIKPVKESDLLEAIARALGTAAVGQESAAPRHERPTEVRPCRILLTEDSLVNQKVAVGLLAMRGHSVVVASTGREALAALERERFDVVLMDVQMPEMDGLEATAAIRARERLNGGHVPIVAMTAHAMKGDRERCLAGGMDDYISKPVEASELYRVVERFAPQPAAPESTPRGAALDWAKALHQVRDQADLLQDVAQVFLDECPKMLAEIHAAIAARDAVRLRRAAHTLKGSAALFAAKPTMDAALKLELIGQQGALSEAESACAELEQETKLLMPNLAAHLPPQ
jgi:CheY-like chemotaxis protein